MRECSFRWAFLAGALVATAACTSPVERTLKDAPSASVTVRDAAGQTVRYRVPPRRIVALEPQASAYLVALGAGDRLAATAAGEQPLDTLLAIPQVTLRPAFDLALLRRLRPDALLVSRTGFSKEIRLLGDQLKAPVLFLPHETLFATPEALRMLGPLVGRPDWADHLADSLEQAIRTVLTQARSEPATPGPSVLVIAGETPFRSVSRETFLGDALQQLGANNLLSAAPERYPALSAESVAQMAPQVVILVSTDGEYPRRVLDAFPSLTVSPAVTGQRFFLADPRRLQQPTLHTPEALRLLAGFLYPTKSNPPNSP